MFVQLGLFCFLKRTRVYFFTVFTLEKLYRSVVLLAVRQ